MAIERVSLMLIKSGYTHQEVKPYDFNSEINLIKSAVNGFLQFGDVAGNNRNMYGKMFTVTFPLANTDVQFDHNLKVIPVGYLQMSSSNGGVVYDGVGITSKTSIFLRSTTANNTVTLFVLG